MIGDTDGKRDCLAVETLSLAFRGETRCTWVGKWGKHGTAQTVSMTDGWKGDERVCWNIQGLLPGGCGSDLSSKEREGKDEGRHREQRRTPQLK